MQIRLTVLLIDAYVHNVYSCCQYRSKEDIRCPGTEVKKIVSNYVVAVKEPCPMKKEQVFLATEPYPQSLRKQHKKRKCMLVCMALDDSITLPRLTFIASRL